MPRVVFTSKMDLTSWLERFGDPSRYTAYRTDKHEIILEPTRSTQPLRYAYLKCLNAEQAKIISEDLARMGYGTIKCSAYHWASDREVWARQVDEMEE